MRRMYDKKQLDSYYKGESGGGTKLYNHAITFGTSDGTSIRASITSSAKTIASLNQEIADLLVYNTILLESGADYYPATILSSLYSAGSIQGQYFVTLPSGVSRQSYEIVYIQADTVTEL